jgi:short-subunit dehydrogenase
VAREFGKQHASVALIARDSERLAAAKRDVEELGGTAKAFEADVANATQLEEAAARIERELGEIDVWVNNAMTTVFSPFVELEPEEFKRVTEVTYLGAVYGTMAALKRMTRRNRGTIVQVGSALAYRSIPLQSAYCAAKHAMVGFTDSIRSELMHQKSKVHVTIVHLPAINTPQFDWCRTKLPGNPQPVPPIYQPEVAARAIVWASSHRRREVFVGWPTVKAIYGQDVAAGFADTYLARHGYDAQQTGERASQGRQDNLFEPVAGNYGAHGRFDDQAIGWSVQSWIDLNRGSAAAIAGGLVGLGVLAWRKLRASA